MKLMNASELFLTAYMRFHARTRPNGAVFTEHDASKYRDFLVAVCQENRESEDAAMLLKGIPSVSLDRWIIVMQKSHYIMANIMQEAGESADGFVRSEDNVGWWEFSKEDNHEG